MALNYQGPVEFDDPIGADTTVSGTSAYQAQSQAAYEAARHGHDERNQSLHGISVGGAGVNPYTLQPDANYAQDSTPSWSPAYQPRLNTVGPNQGTESDYQKMQRHRSEMMNGVQGKARRSKAIAGLLGIFGGALGLENWYLGYYGRAAVQLGISIFSGGLLSIIPSVWGVIDGIRILASGPESRSSYDAYGNLLV